MNLQENEDGTWSQANPLDYVPGLDWEITNELDQWVGRAYDGGHLIEIVTAVTKFGLKFRMWRASRKRNYEEVRYLW